jgi:hypothetical protein
VEILSRWRVGARTPANIAVMSHRTPSPLEPLFIVVPVARAVVVAVALGAASLGVAVASFGEQIGDRIDVPWYHDCRGIAPIVEEC